MKFLVVFSAVLAVAFARPGLLYGAHPYAAVGPVSYATLVAGAPIGSDGRVVDTPEVAHAKAEHAAAHVHEKINLAHEAAKSADAVAVLSPAPLVHSPLGLYSAGLAHPLAISARYAAGAPIGHDGRVVDTPEVAHAKAEHAAAHLHEKINLAHEAARSASYELPIVSAYAAPILQKYYI